MTGLAAAGGGGLRITAAVFAIIGVHWVLGGERLRLTTVTDLWGQLGAGTGAAVSLSALAGAG